MDTNIFTYCFWYLFCTGDAMKKIKYLFLTLILFLNIQFVYAFDNTIKVYDYAQTLTEKEQNDLKEAVTSYVENNKIDMVIIFVRYYSYDTLNTYINEFYNKNGFGIGNDKSGIIMAVDIKQNKIGINVYGSAKDLYSDLEINDIISFLNKIDKNYNKAKQFIKYSNQYISTDIKSLKKDNKYNNINWIIIVIPSIIMPSLIILIILLKLRSKKDINKLNSYVVRNSIVISKREDKFITTHTNQIN